MAELQQSNRRCPFPVDVNGRPHEYVAPSRQAFRRHMVIHHGIEVVIDGRGPRAIERFHQLSPAEAEERRRQLGNRQGGRAAYRRLLRPARAVEVGSADARSPILPKPRAPIDQRQQTGTGYVPVGYNYNDASSMSSLSSGGNTNDLHDIDFTFHSDWLDGFPELADRGSRSGRCTGAA